MTADIFAGTFTNQPLVFAHLWDVASGRYNSEGVEVICNENPNLRLRHYFSREDCHDIEDRLGLATTCVIVFHTAQLTIGTEGTQHLSYVGTYVPLRIAPGEE